MGGEGVVKVMHVCKVSKFYLTILNPKFADYNKMYGKVFKLYSLIKKIAENFFDEEAVQLKPTVKVVLYFIISCLRPFFFLTMKCVLYLFIPLLHFWQTLYSSSSFFPLLFFLLLNYFYFFFSPNFLFFSFFL